jgi:hypothetical protein
MSPLEGCGLLRRFWVVYLTIKFELGTTQIVRNTVQSICNKNAGGFVVKHFVPSLDLFEIRPDSEIESLSVHGVETRGGNRAEFPKCF